MQGTCSFKRVQQAFNAGSSGGAAIGQSLLTDSWNGPLGMGVSVFPFAFIITRLDETFKLRPRIPSSDHTNGIMQENELQVSPRLGCLVSLRRARPLFRIVIQ